LLAVPAVLSHAAHAAPDPASATGERALLLEVHINGQPTGKLATFTERAGVLHALRADLEEFGLIVDPQAPQSADGLIALPGLAANGAQAAWRLDERKQAIHFTLGRGALRPTLLSANPLPLRTSNALDTGRGAVLNYDAVVTSTAGAGQAASALLDARIFGPLGTFTGGAITQTGQGSGMPGFVRLDTTFTRADPDSLRRTSVGDFITQGLSWSRPVRLLGLQIGSDFNLRPDLVTMPMPRLGGETAVPSTVDVLVNGVRQISQNINPGPFEVRQIPVPTGVGEVAVTVQDALGRMSVQRLPFYGSTRLLAAGQNSWSMEAGTVRHGYGLRSWDYRGFASSGTWRHGYSDTLTFEGHAELAARGSNIGGGAYYSMGKWGMLSAAVSSNLNGRGLQGTVGYERISSTLSVAASLTQAQANRRDIASAAGDAVARYVGRASASLSLGRQGTVSGAVARTRAGSAVSTDAQMGMPAQGSDTTLYTLSYTRGLTERTQLFISAYTAQRAEGNSSGFFAGVSFALEANRSGGVNVNNSSGRSTFSAQAMQAAQAAGELGWQLVASEGQYRRAQAQAEYRMPWAHATAGVDSLNGRTSARAGLRGAIATVDGAYTLSGPIQDSFAIVDTDGRAGVPVLYENRPAGVTDSRGLLTLPNLRAYDANRVAIDPLSVESDIEFKSTTQQVRPPARAGTRVKFPLQHLSAALVTLVDPNGVWLPLGAVVEQDSGRTRTPVGHEGQAYLNDLAERNRLIVRMPTGKTCIADFPFQRQEGDHVRVFQAVCAEAM
jgi:outer membrane usher protein